MAMFEGLQSFHPQTQSEADLAASALQEETQYRFPSWSANDAVTLGLSIRKRFRSTVRHAHQGKGAVLSVQTIQGHNLFSCTIGDLGNSNGASDVSLDSWTTLEGMMAVVRRTGHCSFYIEKGMAALGKTPQQLGIHGEFRALGGAFPIWLQNALCCPIAIIGVFSGSSLEDHKLVATAVRDYIKKMNAPPSPEGSYNRLPTNLAIPSHLREQSGSSRHDRHLSQDAGDSVQSSPVRGDSLLRDAQTIPGESVLQGVSGRGEGSTLRPPGRSGDSIMRGSSPRSPRDSEAASRMLRAESSRGGQSMSRASPSTRGGESMYRGEQSTVRGGESTVHGGDGGTYRDGQSTARGGDGATYRDGQSTVRGGESTYRGESTYHGDGDEDSMASWRDRPETAYTYDNPTEY